MQRRYHEFDAKEGGWLGMTLVPWAVILAMTVMFSTMLALDASITSEQRITLFLQSGFFP